MTHDQGIDCDDTHIAEELVDHLETDLKKINKILEEEQFPTFRTRVISLRIDKSVLRDSTGSNP